MSKKSTPSWPLFSKLHHWGYANVCTVDWISVIVLGGTSLTVDLINLYDNNQFTIESCQIFPLLNEVTCKNFQGWGRWGGSMWLQLLENYKWVWTISTVNLIGFNNLTRWLENRCVLRHISNMNFHSWAVLGNWGCRGKKIQTAISMLFF